MNYIPSLPLGNHSVLKLHSIKKELSLSRNVRAKLIFLHSCELKAVVSGGLVFMQVCFPVRSMRSFLVTPLPKRLRGGNTACGCPCPSPFLSLFLSCSLYLIFPLVLSRSPFPALSSPSLFVSAAFFAQSIAVVRASHRGTRQHFPSTFPASLPPSYFSASLLQLFFSTSILLFPSAYTSPSTRLTISTLSPISPLILIAALVWN